MSISQTIAIALAEAALPHDQCMACERQGLPILPLRRALVPDTRPQCLTAAIKEEVMRRPSQQYKPPKNPDCETSSIEQIAATLSLKFWPDRNTPEVYAEIISTELNE